jgi:hypothetical protein
MAEKSLFVLAVTSVTGGCRYTASYKTEGDMATITHKLSMLNFFICRRSAGPDFNTLSDRALKDIGLRLDRRDLNSVKPFWLA